MLCRFCLLLYNVSMALDENSSLRDALAQLNANLSWNGNYAKASLALEAVRWLLFNRPDQQSDSVRTYSFERLEKMEAVLSAFVEQEAGKGRRSSFVRGRMAY